MIKYLVAWIGRQDLEGARQSNPTGPIVDFLRAHPEARAILLSDWPKSAIEDYTQALRARVGVDVEIRSIKLKEPTDYLAIFRAADAALAELGRTTRLDEVAIHTSPGTSAMAAVWILLAKTKYAGATLFKSWLDKRGTPQLAEVEIPFDLTLDVLPDLALRRAALLAPSDA